MPREMKTYVHTRTCTQRLKLALFIRAKIRKNPNVHQLTDKWVSKTQCIHTMKHYSVTKRNDVQTPATTRANLKSSMLSDRSQSQRNTRCMVPFIRNVQNRQIYTNRK